MLTEGPPGGCSPTTLAGRLSVEKRTHMALILANIFFGVGAVLGALGLPATHPLVFALVREIAAGFILLGLSASIYGGRRQSVRLHISENPADDKAAEMNVLGETKPGPELPANIFTSWLLHWRRFAALGLAVFGNQAGFIVGIKLAGPLAASVWQPSQPLFTAAICMAFGWEPTQEKRILGVLLASIGCVAMVLLKTKSPSTPSQHTSSEAIADGDALDSLAVTARYLMGNMLFFCNCLCTSLYVLLSKPTLKQYPALLVTAWSYNAASLFMFIATLIAASVDGAGTFFCPECQPNDNLVSKMFYIPQGAMPALLYYILFASVGSYGLMTWANQNASGTLVMSYSVLQPVIAAILTAFLLFLGVVPSCQDALEQHVACLDYPGIGTLCGMGGVFLGLRLVISTESTQKKIRVDVSETEIDPLLEGGLSLPPVSKDS